MIVDLDIEVPLDLHPIYGETVMVSVMGRKMIVSCWQCRIGQHTFKAEKITSAKVQAKAEKILWNTVKNGRVHKILAIVNGADCWR